MKNQIRPLATFSLITFLAIAPLVAEESAEDLAKKLANPIASLVSLPVQANFDDNIGANGEGSVWRLNIQPVIPLSLNEEWNVISRTILPIIDQKDVPFKGAGESGFGDVVQSFFFSPTSPTKGGWIWGAGPVALLPTGSDDALSAEKWGLGPTVVMLKQDGPWTKGLLVNHIWSFAGDGDRSSVNATFIQPFMAFVSKSQTTYSFNVESTYDWQSGEWSVPVNLIVAQLLKVGDQLIQVGAGVRYWADSAPGGPEDWGFRLQVTWLFPK